MRCGLEKMLLCVLYAVPMWYRGRRSVAVLFLVSPRRVGTGLMLSGEFEGAGVKGKAAVLVAVRSLISTKQSTSTAGSVSESATRAVDKVETSRHLG